MPSDPMLLKKVQQAQSRSQWLIELAPRITDMPALIQKYDDPFLPYCRAVFAATQDFVAGYVFDLAAFLALGAAGAVALERAVAVIAATPATLAVIHGPFARGDYATFVGEMALRADAATVTGIGIATAFEAQGVIGLPVVEGPQGNHDGANLNGGWLRLAGLPFRVARRSFVDRFKRDDFEMSLRHAAESELGR
ncbi:MAG: hypothetical protein U0452_00620 [Anaerolineae bacterium]